MAEAAIMAEEMQPQKKVAFANRKYTNEEKRQREEAELEQLIKENAGEKNSLNKKKNKKLNLQTQKKKHLRSVTLIYVDISRNKLKSLKKKLMI